MEAVLTGMGQLSATRRRVESAHARHVPSTAARGPRTTRLAAEHEVTVLSEATRLAATLSHTSSGGACATIAARCYAIAARCYAIAAHHSTLTSARS